MTHFPTLKGRGTPALQGRSIAGFNANLKHSGERDSRPMSGLLGNLDLVDHFSRDQPLEHPAEEAGVDAVHRRARADLRVKADDGLVGVLLGKTIHQVHFRPDRPAGAGGGILHHFEDVLGASVEVTGENHIELALGVDEDVDAGILGARLLNLLDGEALMDTAMSLPQNESRGLKLLDRVAAQRLERIPEGHLSVGIEAHFDSRVAPEVLIWEEENLILATFRGKRERPIESRSSVGTRADSSSVLADKTLEVRGGIDVGHGDDLRLVSGSVELDVTQDLRELLPAGSNLEEIRHIGHGASGGEVGEDDLLVIAGQDVGGFGHEVNAAEHDELSLRVLVGVFGELVAVPAIVGVGNDLVPLVVMPEDHEPGAEGFSG